MIATTLVVRRTRLLAAAPALALALAHATGPALPQTPPATERLRQVEECLTERFQETDVPRTDYAVLLATRYRHVLRALPRSPATGAVGATVPATARAELDEVLERCRDPAGSHLRPLARVATDRVPDLVDGGDRESLVVALRASVARLERQGGSVVFGTRRVRAADVARGSRTLAALAASGASLAELAVAIRERFDVYRSPGAFGTAEVLFTSYASPVYEGSTERSGRFRYPLYRDPGRASRRALDRAGIYAGGLAGRRLEFAWVADRMDEYQLQIEGSGYVRLDAGGFLHAAYAAQNGRPYRSLGKAMLRDRLFKPWEIDNLAIRRYFRAHPDQQRRYLEMNPSFVFFAPRRVDRLPARPQLIPERSVAADRSYFPRGMLAFADTAAPVYTADGRLVDRMPWRRLVVAEDVGGAIKGAGRIDLYQGQGQAAQHLADTMKEPGALYVLVPRGTEIR
jgi:membrane-bound lytic murein transglycosylase A